MNLGRVSVTEMVSSKQASNHAANLAATYTGQQLHVSGVFIVLLEIALVLENLLPIFVVLFWLPAPARGVGDRLVAAFSVTCILSALVPTPLGLASYFSGGWYGGAPTCMTYQVTSIWCNLSSLALLTYMCINCNFAVWRLRKIKPSPQCQFSYRSLRSPLTSNILNDFTSTSNSPPSSLVKSSQTPVSHRPVSSKQCKSPVLRIKSFSKDKPRSHKHDITGDVPTPSQKNNSNNGRSDILASEHGSECLSQSRVVHPDEKCKHGVISSPSKNQNVKRLGNEHYISIEVEDCMQQSSCDCSTACGTEYFSSSSDCRDCGSQYTSLDTDLKQIEHIPNAKPTVNSNGCFHEFKNTQNQGNSMFSKGHRNIEYVQHSMETEMVADLKLTPFRGCFCASAGQARDYVSLMLFFLFACTLTISSLPVAGFGPRPTHTEKSCRSWLVPIPVAARERTFFITFLLFVYVCLALGCGSGISVCMQVSNRMKRERKRKSRLYLEEDSVPDIVELSALDDMKRQYSLTCVVMAGLLTWLPIVIMLTLQKAGVQISEATLMYSNIATSLPGLLNPLLYSLALAKYRAGYKAIMAKCCSKSKKPKNGVVRGAQSQANMADDEASTDTVLDSSAIGHVCMHGRSNPNFENLPGVNVGDYNNDNDDDDDEDDDFPDDRELVDDDKRKEIPKLNERTPLQAVLVSAPPACAFKTVLANRSKTPWQRQQETFSSLSNDKECLLVSNSDFVSEETGL